MAMKITADISKENITQVCDSVNKEARRLQKNVWIRRMMSLGCLCFTLISMVLLSGLIYHLCDQEERDALMSVPVVRFYAKAAEKIMFGRDIPVVQVGIAAVAVQYLLPFGVYLAMTLLVLLLCRPKAAVDAQEEPARAKQLSAAVEKLYQNWLVLSDSLKFRIVCNYLFTAYTLYVIIMMIVRLGWPGYDLWQIIGAVAVIVVWHLLYKLLLGIYVGLGKLLYMRKNPVTNDLRLKANAYLRSVNPKGAEESAAASKPAAQPAKKDEIIHLEPFTWTVAYAQSNEEKCGDTAMNFVEVARQLLREGDYTGAAAGLDQAAYALEMLSRVPGGEQYVPYLYANQYAASRVYAFGLQDRAAAKFRLEHAVTNAGQYAVNKHEHYERAIRDFKVMNGVLEEFNRGTSLSTLKEYYGSEFPDDILNG